MPFGTFSFGELITSLFIESLGIASTHYKSYEGRCREECSGSGAFAKEFIGRTSAVRILQIEDLQTPCLLVDLDILEQNIRKMADYCVGQKIALRPHVKGIKNPLVAKKQLEAGAIGLACQT